MNLIRKALTTLGGILLAALFIAALAPKATRGIAAALVQVTNTSANPVPTVAADSPANFPFAAPICFQIPLTCGGAQSFIVPTTTSTGLPVKRLVIENFCIPFGSRFAEQFARSVCRRWIDCSHLYRPRRHRQRRMGRRSSKW